MLHPKSRTYRRMCMCLHIAIMRAYKRGRCSYLFVSVYLIGAGRGGAGRGMCSSCSLGKLWKYLAYAFIDWLGVDNFPCPKGIHTPSQEYYYGSNAGNTPGPENSYVWEEGQPTLNQIIGFERNQHLSTNFRGQRKLPDLMNRFTGTGKATYAPNAFSLCRFRAPTFLGCLPCPTHRPNILRIQSVRSHNEVKQNLFR